MCAVYLPLTAVHVPRVTGAAVAPAAIAPLTEPVRVATVALFWSSRVTVMPCEPLVVAIVPWFLTEAVKVTVLPFDGFGGVQDSVPTRSADCTGATTRLVGLV